MSLRPKTCQMVPTTFHGMSSGSAIRTRQTATLQPLRGMRQRDDDAERHLDREDDARRRGGCAARSRGSGCRDRWCRRALLEPADAVPEELVVPEGVLDRIVDHRHQRDDRREGDDGEHRQDEEPGAVVERLVHQRASPGDEGAVGIDVDLARVEDHAASSPARRASSGARRGDRRAGERDAGDAAGAEVVDAPQLHRQAGAGRRAGEFGPDADLDRLPQARRDSRGRAAITASPTRAGRPRPRPSSGSCPASR